MPPTSVIQGEEKRSTPRLFSWEVRSPALPVVGIAASAARLDALRELFDRTRTDLGLAYVVFVHPNDEMPERTHELLAPTTRMPISFVTERVALRPDHVYLLPPGHALDIDIASVASRSDTTTPTSAVDQFFRSLALHRGDGFGLVLPGVTLHGVAGLRALKESGGLVFVDDPDGRPDLPADFVIPVGEMPARLAELARRKRADLVRVQSQPGGTHDAEPEPLQAILGLLRNHSGNDFSRYRQGLAQRHIRRRMYICREETLAGYLAYLYREPVELDSLFKDLLVSLTAFFRDPASFERLAATALPELWRGAGALEREVRIWVPGCATGEEAYSLAMLASEVAERQPGSAREVRVFGSDIDPAALTHARVALYPLAIEADVSPPRLARFFTREMMGYRVGGPTRDQVVFGTQNLLQDPPFSQIDLVSCRNLLVHMTRELREEALSVLQYALRPGGYLFVGAREEVRDGRFVAVDRAHGIYRSVCEVRRPPRLLPRGEPRSAPGAGAAPVSSESLHRQCLEALAPPSALINDRGRIVNLSPGAGRFLVQPGGPLCDELTQLVHPDLQAELRPMLGRALRHGEGGMTVPVPVRLDGETRRVALGIWPRASEEGLALVTFLDAGPAEPPEGAAAPVDGTDPRSVARLRGELHRAREEIRRLGAEAEAAQEEYCVANEELQSINEEYRSVAEKLEVKREELESANQELRLLNEQLKLRLADAARANCDLENLMAATDIGTVFLDDELRIHRMTPSLSELLCATPADIGRKITDFKPALRYTELEADARRVLRELVPVEREVGTSAGGWVLIRLRPYQTVDHTIDGVVLTFVDVTEQKTTEEALRSSQEQLGRELEAIRRLHQMTNSMVLASTVREGLGECLGAALELTRTDRAMIHLLDLDDGTLALEVHRGFGAVELAAWERLAVEGESICSRACRRRSRVVLDEGVQAVPLVSHGGKVLGVLSTHSPGPRPYSVQEGRLLDLLTRQAADLLDRLRTEEALKLRTAELHQRERELEVQAEELRSTDRRKSEFLSLLSHELRNPLAVVRNSLSLLHERARAGDREDSDFGKILAMLDRQSQHMAHLVGDLLDIARINKGKIVLKRAAVSLSDSVSEVLAAVAHRLESRKLSVTVDLPTGPPLFADADPERLAQILDNVISNAIKFTEPGGRLEITGWWESGLVITQISDSGAGVPAEALPTLFEPFTQVARSDRTGLGLGLSLVKSLVELHGGTVSLTSPGLGLGTTVSFSLPAAPVPHVAAREHDAASQTRRRTIMVVDDNEDAAESFACLLRARGHAVHCAFSGEEALSLVNSIRPEVAFLDIGMPDMDGYELAEHLRRAFSAQALTLVAVSGYLPDERFARVGLDHHLLKPTKIEEVEQVLATLSFA